MYLIIDSLNDRSFFIKLIFIEVEIFSYYIKFFYFLIINKVYYFIFFKKKVIFIFKIIILLKLLGSNVK